MTGKYNAPPRTHDLHTHTHTHVILLIPGKKLIVSRSQFFSGFSVSHTATWIVCILSRSRCTQGGSCERVYVCKHTRERHRPTLFYHLSIFQPNPKCFKTSLLHRSQSTIRFEHATREISSGSLVSM